MNEDLIYQISQIESLARKSKEIISLTEVRNRYMESQFQHISQALVYDDTQILTTLPDETVVYRAVDPDSLRFNDYGDLTDYQYLNNQPDVISARIFITPTGFSYLTVETSHLFLDFYGQEWHAEKKLSDEQIVNEVNNNSHAN